MSTNLIYQVHFNCELKTKNEVYTFISEIACQNNAWQKEIINQLNNREENGSIQISENVILPHIESDLIKKSQIILIRLANPIKTWDFQTENILLFIVILLKRNESEQLKEKVSLFIRTLADEEYLNRLINARDKTEFNKIMKKH